MSWVCGGAFVDVGADLVLHDRGERRRDRRLQGHDDRAAGAGDRGLLRRNGQQAGADSTAVIGGGGADAGGRVGGDAVDAG